MPYASMIHVPSTKYHLLSAKQKQQQKACLNEKYRFFLKEKTERALIGFHSHAIGRVLKIHKISLETKIKQTVQTLNRNFREKKK